MCRKHNPTSRHRRIVHGTGAVESEEGFGSMVVPQVRGALTTGTVLPDPHQSEKVDRVLHPVFDLRPGLQLHSIP